MLVRLFGWLCAHWLMRARIVVYTRVRMLVRPSVTVGSVGLLTSILAGLKSFALYCTIWRLPLLLVVGTIACSWRKNTWRALFCFWCPGVQSSSLRCIKKQNGWRKSSVLHCDRAEREGLATTLPMVAPLNAHPFCSPQGPLQAHYAKSGKPPTLFSHLRLQVNLR